MDSLTDISLTGHDQAIETHLDYKTLQEAGRNLQARINSAGYLYLERIAKSLGIPIDDLANFDQQVPKDQSTFTLPDGGYLEVITPQGHKLIVSRDREKAFHGVRRVYPNGTVAYHELDSFLGFADTEKPGIVFNTFLVIPRREGEQAIQIGRSVSLSAGLGVDDPLFTPPPLRLSELATGHFLGEEQGEQPLSRELVWDILDQGDEQTWRCRLEFNQLISIQSEGINITHSGHWKNNRLTHYFIFAHPVPLGADIGGDFDVRHISSRIPRSQSVLDLQYFPNIGEIRVIPTHSRGIGENPLFTLPHMSEFAQRAGLNPQAAPAYYQAVIDSFRNTGDKIIIGDNHMLFKPNPVQSYCQLARAISPLFPASEQDLYKTTLPVSKPLLSTPP